MSYDYGIPTSLLRFLGACIYGDAQSYYAGLAEAERSELENQGRSFGMFAWFYRYLYNTLPEEKRVDHQKIYQMRQIKAMMGAQELKRLFRVLAANNLRFVPIKGADFAYRLYPDAALRVFGDWDIWFHPDDSENALSVLSKDGWKNADSDCSSDGGDVMLNKGRHHFPPHMRGNLLLEPHFSLANFEGIDLYEMWEHTRECPAGDGQRVLSPEMNLLMLTRHAASRYYFHANIPKLLADAAMLMQKERVDFDKLRKLADSWKLPFPGDLLAAFPEFFPGDVMDGFGADPVKSAEFRRLFELRGELGKPTGISLVLSRSAVKRNMTGEVLNHIRAHDVSVIRRMYCLPKHGAWGRVAWAYVCWFCTRIWCAMAWLQHKTKFRNFVLAVESVESARNNRAH